MIGSGDASVVVGCRLSVAMFLAFGLSNLATAQPIGAPAAISPAAPSSVDVIRAVFTQEGGECHAEYATLVTGSLIRTTVTLSNCPAGPPPISVLTEVSFGPLAAGMYTYEIYVRYDADPPELRSRQTITVAEATAVPSLSRLGILLLAGVIAIAGVWLVGSRY